MPRDARALYLLTRTATRRWAGGLRSISGRHKGDQNLHCAPPAQRRVAVTQDAALAACADAQFSAQIDVARARYARNLCVCLVSRFAQIVPLALMTFAHRIFNSMAHAHGILSFFQRVSSLLRTVYALRKRRPAPAQGLNRLLAQLFCPRRLPNIVPVARTGPDFGVRAGNAFALQSPQWEDSDQLRIPRMSFMRWLGSERSIIIGCHDAMAEAGGRSTDVRHHSSDDGHGPGQDR